MMKMMMMIIIIIITKIALISCIFPNGQNNLMASIKTSNITQTITYIKPTKNKKKQVHIIHIPNKSKLRREYVNISTVNIF
jgi:outer membrane lipoprotein-sorting protein